MKRIFIVSHRGLFRHGVENLLRSTVGLEIVGRAECVGEALTRIAELQPDVVVLGDDEREVMPAPLVLRLLREGLCGRVVAVDMEGNALCVYSGARRAVAGAVDLIEAVQGE